MVSDEALRLLGRVFATLAFKTPALQVYDLQLDHWGIGRQGTESFQAMRERLEGPNSPVRRWALSKHNAFYDNSIKGVSELPDETKIPSPHIHYFTLSFHATVLFPEKYPDWGSEAAEKFPASMHAFAEAILKLIPIVGNKTDWLLSHTIFQPIPFVQDPIEWVLAKLKGVAGWTIFALSVPLMDLVRWGTVQVAQRLVNGFGYGLILPLSGRYLPRPDVIPLMLPTVYAMGGQPLSRDEIEILGLSNDEIDIVGDDRGDWYLNDGIVNTASMDGPVGTEVLPISGFLPKIANERRGCYWHFGTNDVMDHADEIGVWVEKNTASSTQSKKMYAAYSCGYKGERNGPHVRTSRNACVASEGGGYRCSRREGIRLSASLKVLYFAEGSLKIVCCLNPSIERKVVESTGKTLGAQHEHLWRAFRHVSRR
jgi:hypothetical protein